MISSLNLCTACAQAARLEPRPLGASANQQLLQEWSEQSKHISLLPSISAFAEHVYSLTAGHAGLTGVCLDELTSLAQRQNQLTLAEWSRFAVATLPDSLHNLKTYNKIVSDVGKLDESTLDILNEVSY